MRRLLISTLALVVALGALFAVVGPVQAQKIPGDFAYEGAKDSPGKVTFSHEKHKAAGVEKCNACHTKVFKMKKGTTGNVVHAKMNAGESCGSCHNGKEMGGKTPVATSDKAKCESCHKKG